MKILSVSERTVPLGSATRNAVISFSSMTATAVTIEIETANHRYHGLGFSSYGRYGHGGLLRERFIPRLLNAPSRDFIDPETDVFSMERFWNVLMQDEKPGGHGERSGAVGVLETAMWDAIAKSEGLPLWGLLERNFGHSKDQGLPSGQTKIYASGGQYGQNGASSEAVARESSRAIEEGYSWFKIKVGGASEQEDESRIDAAINSVGDSRLIAVDANCVFGETLNSKLVGQLDNLQLRWIEEPVDPLDFDGLSNFVGSYQTPIATGENIFSSVDMVNLLRFGGLSAEKDILQMDINLSYGIEEFLRMIKAAEEFGWSRRDFIPHAGHQLALHVSAGLGLGGHEVAFTTDSPFEGVSDDTRIEGGTAYLSDSPGVGIENKPTLYRYFDGLID